ncbi:MAG: hydantoinase B/oxoprolinase family protein, partial [Alphaproteobacteria bacterium]|nr:hydantoinase B/oxoprolinase family protein [Alphaproteobacteria bacterium]
AEHISMIRTAHIRNDSSHQALPVIFGSETEMIKNFEIAHQQRFGFIPEYERLIIELLTSEAIGKTGEIATFGKADKIANLENKGVNPPDNINQTAKMFSGNQWGNVPLVDRQKLTKGDMINGPAIIFEPTGTNILEAGWQAETLADGNLVMTRAVAVQRENAVGTSVNPVMLEVFNNLFMSIAEQMGATLANTAYSVNIKERYDFSCAIFSPQGDLVANAPHVPVHLGSMSDSVRIILSENAGDIKAGDVFMMNNPYKGGTHLPDITVITPVFDKAGVEIMFIVASRGHHADIGGKTPGSAPPDSTHIEEEGILIDNFLLVKQGKLRDAETRFLLASGKYPCRNIEQNMADLKAQIAANATGLRELIKAIDTYGLDVVHAYMGHVQDNAEESVRRVLAVLKNSSYSYVLDSGAKIEVKISANNEARKAVIDFSGTSPQDKLNYNAPFAVCRAVVLYVFRTLIASDIPMNEGCMKPLELIVPDGSMINPKYPAAVIAGNTEISQSITDALYGALGVIAGSQGTMNNFVYGNDIYQNYETICGGTGAGNGFHGTDAVHSHMTNTRMTDPEILEIRFPVRVEETSIRRGSGGAGLFKGGDGIIRKLRFLSEMTTTILSSHRKTQPFGVAGGEAGMAGKNWVIRADGTQVALNGNDQILMAKNDIFVLETPGGGGYGKI